MSAYVRAALTCAALSFTTPALAETCHLTQLASIDMLPGARRILIPAKINGAQAPMLLDTGGGVSAVTEKTVKSLNLFRQEADLKLLDLYGKASRQFVRLDTLELGDRVKGKDINLMILPDGNDDFDGLVGGDMLMRYDVELNFAARKVNLFSQDHCDGKVVYWPATAGTVIPFSMRRPLRDTLGVEIGQDTHIRIPVVLDGKTLQAIVDTGAPTTTLSAGTAKRVFDVTGQSPGVVPSNDAQDPAFGYVFHSLSFGGITAANPHIEIFPDMMGTRDRDNTAVTGSMIAHNDDGMQDPLIIGMDVLTQLHLYIAYGEQKLYVTPPDPPAPSSPAR